jgi:NTP pyrophosphatase (non-canonical NTP hydrolase)
MTEDADKIKEILVITQEECAETIQIISKILRFGLDSAYAGQTNREKLEAELGDVLAMISLMEHFELVSSANLEKAKQQKLEKLKTWSSIFKDKDLS